MATSGNFVTSDSGQGGGNYYGRMIFEWWETSRGISGSVGYHNISYHLKTYGGSTAYWQYFYQGSMNVDGSGYSFPSPTKAYGGGATVFGDYSKTMYTDSAGNRSFGASAQGGVYNNTINTSGSGSWSLDNIPLHANITGATGNIDDEATSFYTTYNNPAGGSIDTYLDLPSLATGGYARTFGYASGASVSLASDISSIRAAMVNVNSTTLRYVIHDTIGGADSWSFFDYTIAIKNDTGQANPTFSDYTYKDNNSSTVTITGNDQYLIQGYSDLLVTVSTANKATPNKAANMSYYTVTIGGYSNNATYSSSVDVTKDVGTVSDVTGAQNLNVRAVDSRGNSTSVAKSVTVLPYAVPIVNSTAVRANGYDDALILTVAGSISPLTISSTDKNTISSTTTSTANRAEYRVAVDGGSYGSWTDVATTQTSGTGAIAGNSTVIIAAAGTVSATHAYQVQVRIKDKLNTTVQTLSIPTGTPIFRIGLDKSVYFNEVAYLSVNSITSSSTPAPVGSAALNQYFITALAANATIPAPSGTPTNGNRLMIRIKDNGTSRTLTWNSIYRGIGAILPTATTAGKTTYIGIVYNAADDKWDCVVVNQET